jgi:hypothetical protein
MANNKEEAGKGTPRPSETAPGTKRPYTTLDLTATEIEGRDRAAASAASRAAASASSEPSKSQGKADTKPAESGAKSADPAAPSDAGGFKAGAAVASVAARLRALPFLTHVAAGAVGALLAVALVQFLIPERNPTQPPGVSDLTRRISELEGMLGLRPGAGLRAKVDELSRSVGALGETQARLARETEALGGKIGSGPEVPQELTSRLAKLEEALGAAAAADPSKQAPQVAALAAKLATLEKTARDAGEAAKSGVGRFDSEMSSVRTEAGRLSQRLDGLKGEVEERLKGMARATDLSALAAGVTSLEREVQAVMKTEADRSANASQILLALELANLKRAIDRGEGYAPELARVKRIGGFTINFTVLERYSLEGVSPPQELARSFRKMANAMLDAEAESADASLLDRLLAGARSIVRVRKAGHAADDNSLEAVIGRMETALKEDRLGEVLAYGKKLPPKAALVAEDWLRKVEARYAVEQAMAEAEATLKASLGPGRATGSDTKPESGAKR